MNSKELKAAKVQLFRDAANFKGTERIPHFANVVTWKVFDAGYNLDQAMTNFDVLEESVVKFLDRYPVDGLMDVGIRNQFTVTEAFGEGGYYYYDENVVGIHDHAHCTVQTLQQYLDDPAKYAWEVILPKKYGASWDEKGLSVWKKPSPRICAIPSTFCIWQASPASAEACKNIGADEWAHSPQKTVATCKAWSE